MAKTLPTDPTLDPVDAAAAAASAETGDASTEAPKLGSNVFLHAVHGQIVHPSTAQSFEVGTPAKAEVDAWVLMQYAAGKLATA